MKNVHTYANFVEKVLKQRNSFKTMLWLTQVPTFFNKTLNGSVRIEKNLNS